MNLIQFYRLFAIGGAFLVGFWLPIRLIGFVPPAPVEVFFDLVISAISILNIVLHFHDEEKNWKQLKNWLNASVLMDVVCMLPFSLVAFVVFDNTISGILFINLLTVRHVRHIREFLDGFPSLQPMTYRLVPVFIMLPLLVHLISCGWVALGSGTAGDSESQILTYVKAVYWAFTTLTTVGYGDIAAKTIPQMLYACVVQVTGVGVFGFILSNVASLLARSDAAREHHMDSLDKVETFMKLHHIPSELRKSIRNYYHYMWMNKKGYQDSSLLDGLPTKIQSELLMHINRSIVEKVPFLRGAEPELIGELMSKLKARVFVPGEKIFKIDETGDNLYFIQSGDVEIITRDDSIICTLGEGSFFGEIALISEKPRTATAKAKTYCDVYSLSRSDFQFVTTSYPQFKVHLESIMAERQAS